MKRFIRLIEGILILALAIVCLVVSLADFFGLFNLIPADRISVLTLLLVSLVLSSLYFVQTRSVEAHEDLQSLLSKIEPEHMEKALQHIDPHLIRVLRDDYFIAILEFFQTAVKESKVQLNDKTRFCFYFIRSLQIYPKSTFLSTASALWDIPAIEEAIKQFIQKGGRMEQVIFVKNAQELSSPALQTMIARLENLNVHVYIIDGSATPGELKKNFIVESRRKIAWEIQIDNNGHIVSSILTTNKHFTMRDCRAFEELRESEIRY